jgi:hypothetical protein
MKFGYCVSMGAQDPAGIGYERIPQLQKMGYDYVEMPLAQVMNLNEQAFCSGPLAMVAMRASLPANEQFLPRELSPDRLRSRS